MGSYEGVSPSEGTENEYSGIFGITVSFRMDERYPLFSRPKSDETSQSLSAVGRILQQFQNGSFQIADIESVSRWLGGNPSIQHGNPTIVEDAAKYKLDYFKSVILDFGDIPDQLEFNQIWSRNPALTSIIEGERTAHNEFIISHKERVSKYLDYYKVSYNLLLLMGMRRSDIFTRSLGLRLFNLSLPPGLLTPMPPSKSSEYYERVQKETGAYVVVPMLTFIRMPRETRFRRLVSLTLNFIPCDSEFSASRMVSAHEISHLFYKGKFFLESGASKFTLSGPLLDYMKSLKEGAAVAEEVDSEILTNEVLKIVAVQISSGKMGGDEWDKLLEDADISRENTEIVLTDKIDDTSIESFYGATDDTSHSKKMRDELRKIVTPLDYLVDIDYDRSHVTPDIADFMGMNTANKNRTSVTIMSFYNPYSETRIMVSERRREQFPMHSIKRAYFWHLYITIAISSLKTMIHSFYREIRRDVGLSALLDIENSLLSDAEEYYDLDIKAQYYKEQYEMAKVVAGLDSDYAKLEDKMEVLKNNITIKDSKNLTYVLIYFAATSIIGTIYFTSHSVWVLSVPAILTALLGVYFLADFRKRIRARRV